MLTALVSLGHVNGAGLWLLGWVICALCYLGGCLLFSANRKRKCAVWISLALAELLCDLCWALLYYPDGVYVNHGIGAAYGMFLWPMLLLIAALVVTTRNIIKAARQEDAI